MILDQFNEYIDEKGCMVCKDAVEGGQAGKEDSAHKAAFYNFYLALCYGQGEIFWKNFIPPQKYVDIGGLKRHPLTKYTTSRDQTLPFLIMLDSIGYVALKKVIKYQIENCYVEKEELKKYEWFIRLFYHTPNGDMFIVPNHLSALFRTLDKKWYWLTDMFLPLIVLATFFKKNDKHLVSQIMQLDYFEMKNPNIFTKLSYWLFHKFHNRCIIANEYFSGDNNPPINILMR